MHSRKYQVEKSTALGLILPQNLRLEVRELDEEDHDLGLLYETTNLKWWECMATCPPKFLLLSAGSSHGLEKGITTEINAAIAKVMRPLGNLPPSTRAIIEMGYVSEHFKGSEGLHSNSHHEWQILQKGFKRHYTLQPARCSPEDGEATTFTWRGSHSVLSSLDSTEDHAHAKTVPSKGSPVCHGNLKFQGGPNNQLLAAWKQRRDSKVLGTLYVFDAAQDYLPLEVVVTSCLYVVVVERVLWTTFFGS